MLKNYLAGKLELNWKLGLLLILVFGSLRFLAVIYGIQTGDNKYLSIIFVLMMIVPFAILSVQGKRFIKIQKPKNWLSLIYAILLGVGICFAIFLIGKMLYGNSLSNWFKYIGESYPVDFTNISASDKKIYFFVFVGIGMTFSPIGEELLYRGLVHGCFLEKFGKMKSAIVDSAAFGITHLAHFGLIYQNDAWGIDLIPALLWVILMFITGLVLNVSKSISDSIWGAIVCHMAFNVMMTYLIFYRIF